MHRGRARGGVGAEAEAHVADRVFEGVAGAGAEPQHPAVDDPVGPVAVAPERDAGDRRLAASRRPAAPAGAPGVEDEEALGGVADDQEGVVLRAGASAPGLRRDDLALCRRDAVGQPAPVQLGRDEEGAGLVQGGVVGVEVRPQPVVGAEGDVAGVAGALDVDLAGRVAGDVGPAALAADAVVVEGLDHVAQRDALGLVGVVLQPGGLVEHPGADARAPTMAGAQPLEVDQPGERLAAAGALGALVARQGPVFAALAQHREQRLVGQELWGQAGERRLVGAVAQVDGVAQDAAAHRRGRRVGRAAAGHVRPPARGRRLGALNTRSASLNFRGNAGPSN